MLVVHSLDVGVECGRGVGALDVHDQLALVHDVAETDMQGDDAAIGKRQDRDLAGDVGVD